MLSLRVIGTLLLGLGGIALPCLSLAEAKPAATARFIEKATAPGHWRITIVQSNPTDVSVAQAMLLPRAEALCGDQPMRVGHYSFEMKEALSVSGGKPLQVPVITLVQDIACGETTPPLILGPAILRSDADAAETGLTFARRYLIARNGGEVKAAMALLDPEAGIADGIGRDMASPRNSLGALVGTPRYKVTVYRDPPNAPGPGLYIAVDFAMEYEKAPSVCGYVLAHEPPGGNFAITREERGVIGAATAAKTKLQDLATLREKLLCNVP